MNEEQQSTRRRPRKIKRQPEQQAEILQEQSKDNDEDSHSLKNDKPETASQSRPSQSCNRRRPKKLPREASATDSQAFEIEMKKQGQSEISDEIMSLKTRVEDIERQVREISTSRKGPTKSSRRRLRRTKSTTEGDTEADELVNLQGDLVEATKELEALQAEPQAIKDEETQREDTDVEEILRHDDNMAFEQESPRLDKQRRSVALSGSYRFNLPQVMSDSDIQAVQTGIHGIQNIARKFVNEHSSQGTARESMTQQGSRSDEGWR